MKNLLLKLNSSSPAKLTLVLFIFIILISGNDVVKAQITVSDNIPQYLFNRFADGLIVKKSGEKVLASLNYNIVTEEMIFLENDRFMALGNLQSIDTVYLNNMIFLPAGDAFYELAVIGKVKLLVQFSGTVQVEGEDVGYGITSKTSRVTSLSALTNSGVLYNMDLPENLKVSRKITYHVEVDGERERFINKRAFLRIFKDKKKELDRYIKEENVEFDNYNDIVSLVKYMNSNM
ncbi:MAG: hypothetical protein JW965_11170 [Bacteroidales bacterium]|nr:hypothetical protein [Bacteroidales bacterium]